jgi:hypothetical protein
MSEDDLDRLLDEIERMLGPFREPIPIKFYRTFEEKPFETCDFCGKYLLQPRTNYMINKYYAQSELKQEIAICKDCLDDLRSSYSKKSMENMKKIFSEQLIKTQQMFVRDVHENRVARLTRRCLLCSKEKVNIQEYFEYAYCDGDEILYHVYPTKQCGACTVWLLRSLSEETLEIRRDYFHTHFGLPPSGQVFEPIDLMMLSASY